MKSRRNLARFVVKELATMSDKQRKGFIKRLAAYLIDTKQTAALDLLVKDIALELQNSGVLEAWVRTARPLTEELSDELKQLLARATGVEHVRLNENIDESLIGGLVVRTPDLELDLSLKRKLATLRR